MYSVERYHDISCGHRVVGHEGKCRFLHGHNYRIFFTCMPSSVTGLDNLGRVIDFGVIKAKLCQWLEDNWDHKFLLWDQDTEMMEAQTILLMRESYVWVPFNPTAENIAKYLVSTVGPTQLSGTGATLVSVCVEETRKCSATYVQAH